MFDWAPPEEVGGGRVGGLRGDEPLQLSVVGCGWRALPQKQGDCGSFSSTVMRWVKSLRKRSLGPSTDCNR